MTNKLLLIAVLVCIASPATAGSFLVEQVTVPTETVEDETAEATSGVTITRGIVPFQVQPQPRRWRGRWRGARQVRAFRRAHRERLVRPPPE